MGLEYLTEDLNKTVYLIPIGLLSDFSDRKNQVRNGEVTQQEFDAEFSQYLFTEE